MNTAAGNYEPEQIPSRTEMTSLVEIKSRLVAIEQGQSVLCERLDNLIAERARTMAEVYEERAKGKKWYAWATQTLQGIQAKLDCLQGKELLSQFKAKPKRRKR